MAGRFTWLDRIEGESVRAYDKRINDLAAFHSGYAFLSYENYCPEFCAFAVYTVWNHEFNHKLANPLPDGGFMMHCDTKRAEEMCAMGHGFPIFVKLISKLGRLYVESFALADKEVVYDLYFNGCEVKPPEGHVFYGNETPGLMPVASKEAVPYAAAGSFRTVMGSYRKAGFHKGSFLKGSYRKGAFGTGSYRGGSFVAGSYFGGKYGLGSYLRGSYIRGSFRGGLSGSYLSWFFGGGSSYRLLFGAGSFSNAFLSAGSFYSAFGGGSYKGFSFTQGSYFSGSFTGGSFLRSSYIGSSFHGRYFLTGSFYNGSYNRGSFIYGGFADVLVSSQHSDGAKASENAGNVHEEFVMRRLIEELGYGLDLI